MFPGSLALQWKQGPINPGKIALIHMDPEVGVTLDGTPEVSAWTNQGTGGSTYDFAQGTAANRFGTSTLNGRTVFTTDGSAAILCTAALSSQRFLHDGTGCDCLAVVQIASTGTAQSIVNSKNTGTGGQLLVSGAARAQIDIENGSSENIGQLGDSTMSTGTTYVMRWSYNQGLASERLLATLDLDIPATSSPTFTPNIGDAEGAITIGARPGGSFPLLSGGLIGDIILHNARFTPAEVAGIQKWLLLKYGMVGSSWETAGLSGLITN